MSKGLRIVLLIVLIAAPLLLYRSVHKGKHQKEIMIPAIDKEVSNINPQIAIVFDDLGESLQELREIYALDIPVTISVIPGLKFSKNIAHIASRCGLSVLIHLPLEPKAEAQYRTNKYTFISDSLSKREIEGLLRFYLNAIRVAIGVNNHMGSAATENRPLMRMVLKRIKQKGLLFLDSRTSLSSVAYDEAKKADMICGYSEGFLDSVDEYPLMQERLAGFVAKAKESGKIIIIAHPKSKTLQLLRAQLPALRSQVDFITLKEYFEL